MNSLANCFLETFSLKINLVVGRKILDSKFDLRATLAFSSYASDYLLMYTPLKQLVHLRKNSTQSYG